MMISSSYLPLIGITMGDPRGIGPEILVRALNRSDILSRCRPVVFGDPGIIRHALERFGIPLILHPVTAPQDGRFEPGYVNILPVSRLNTDVISLPGPTPETGRAMAGYIETGVDLAMARQIDALVTGPITKTGLRLGGRDFPGHTELIASRTHTREFAMMLTGPRLTVVLVTIHIPLSRVSESLTTKTIHRTICLTHDALTRRFGIPFPRIAVAGLNPHAGEETLFGREEPDIIAPAVAESRAQNISVTGPLPPDTVFFQAMNQQFDAVVCMYHDQGLIPFKLLHFRDGVNTTLGLPIIRTSVDHGTAYDIAWQGRADPESLAAAIHMADRQARHQSGF